ncbi:hypothetical protein [Luteibacter sp. Lutesp34]|uniref:hypothetical protein n=1 Tax=Luteibacter sp. Lutesp34 TaxID=3243030 RepID=UPI0039B4A00B
MNFDLYDMDRSLQICKGISKHWKVHIRPFPDPLFEASITLFLIRLHHLLMRADRGGRRLRFADDMPIGFDGDITDLISAARNAACHSETGRHTRADGTRFQFITIDGKGRIDVGGIVAENMYKDDIAIFFGDLRIYVWRHLLRALIEIEDIFRDDLAVLQSWKANPKSEGTFTARTFP